MKITITQEEYETCWEELKNNAPESIAWNHYDLAENTMISDKEVWKRFLQIPEVVEWLDSERKLLQKYELVKLSTDVANSRSVGQAQLISAMGKINAENTDDTAKGPAFIYCYIPLNEQQKHAPNVKILDSDIFFTGEKKL